jgi:hypothetical protein
MKNSPEQVTSFTCDTLLLAYIGYISEDLTTKHFYMCNFKWAGLHLSSQIEKAMLLILGPFLPNQPMAIMSSLSMKNSPEHLMSFMGDAFILACIEYISGDSLIKHFTYVILGNRAYHKL